MNWKKKQTIKRVKTNSTNNKRVSKEIRVCLYEVPRGLKRLREGEYIVWLKHSCKYSGQSFAHTVTLCNGCEGFEFTQLLLLHVKEIEERMQFILLSCTAAFNSE